MALLREQTQWLACWLCKVIVGGEGTRLGVGTTTTVCPYGG